MIQDVAKSGFVASWIDASTQNQPHIFAEQCLEHEIMMWSAQDLLNIARTTLSSKILTHDKDHFAELAVDAVLRLKGSTNLEAIQIIKKPGGTLKVRLSFSRSGVTNI